MKTVVGIALAAVLALTIQPVRAGDVTKGPITVTGAWARATPPAAPAGGAFMTIANTGKEDDNLIGAKAGASKSAELHMHLDDNGVMRMREVQNINVRAGQSVTIEPGGLHVMLIGLHAPLVQGKSFPLTLEFERAGEVTVGVDVQPAGALVPAGMVHDPAMHERVRGHGN